MSKKILIFLVFILLLFPGCSSNEESIKTVGIKDLSVDPGAYNGKIAIKGVVQSVDTSNFLFRLVDEEEFKSCGLNPCAAANIVTIYTPDSTKPVGKTPSDYEYNVKMPKLEDLVSIEGEIKKMDQGYTFEVDKVIKGSNTIISKKDSNKEEK